jgi:hypothetical protein
LVDCCCCPMEREEREEEHCLAGYSTAKVRDLAGEERWLAERSTEVEVEPGFAAGEEEPVVVDEELAELEEEGHWALEERECSVVEQEEQEGVEQV